MTPADMPPPERWANRPHGTRLRYLSGCRCLQCRAAHSREVGRYRRLALTGRGNPIVDATPMLEHLRRLQAAGLGYKRAATLAGIGHTVVFKVLSGRKRRVRKATVDKVLAVAVDAVRPALVPAEPTRALLRRLIRDGYPAIRLARHLGCKSNLQIARGERVTARTAERVRRLAAILLAGVA